MKNVHIWMQMLGFDREDPDRGVARFLEKTGFVPDSICGLLFHSDFVNLHRGMEEEYVLFPDNCAYHGIPRNRERARQDWTNYDLRELVANLNAKGVKFYVGIMGSYLNDMYHHEWLTDHPEVRRNRRDKVGGVMCLKRMADGSYYEDFFAKKLVQTLADYDMAGVHLADSFCPSSQLYMTDYSTDMTQQFMMHTGITLDDEMMQTLGNDDVKTINLRADYLWENYREEWIRFYEWRWEQFFKKVCDAVHKAGKEVWVLGMYCTDPFETRYLQGIDCKRIMEAGVDCITANILPTSVSLNAKGYPYYFHRMHMDLPLMRSHVGNRQVVSMVNVQDASEEWSVLEHRPVQLERDVYTMTSYQVKDGAQYKPAQDGLFLCLGDGIDPHGWQFLKSRMEVGLSTEASRVWSPMVLWSDHANDIFLGEYIRTRRTSAHKQSFEIFKAGVPFGGAVRTDALDGFNGVAFVPNFDLLTEQEQAALATAEFAWVATMPADFTYGDLPVSFEFRDSFSDYPLKAVAHGIRVSEELAGKIQKLCAEDDGTASTANDPDIAMSALYGEVPFTKLTAGFVQALGELLKSAMYVNFPVTASQPMMALRMPNGKDRLFLYNPDEDHYDHVVVTCDTDTKSVEIASHYPVLPPRFIQRQNTAFSFNYGKKADRTNQFQVKLAPGGVTIVDIGW